MAVIVSAGKTERNPLHASNPAIRLANLTSHGRCKMLKEMWVSSMLLQICSRPFFISIAHGGRIPAPGIVSHMCMCFCLCVRVCPGYSTLSPGPHPTLYSAEARVLGCPAAHGQVGRQQLGIDDLVCDGLQFLSSSVSLLSLLDD